MLYTLKTCDHKWAVRIQHIAIWQRYRESVKLCNRLEFGNAKVSMRLREYE
jgi:hypothetical protein